MRTIFFNGPKGHRWVTTPAPTEENPPAPPPAPQTDERAADRRHFFGVLNAMHARLERHGMSVDDVRRCYAKRFGVEGMSACLQREWAIAAAEVQAMFQSPEIFAIRIAQFKAQKEEGCPSQRPLPSKSNSTKSYSTKGTGAKGRFSIGYMLLPPASRTSTHSAFPSPLRIGS